MSRVLWRALLLGPAVLGVSLAISTVAAAEVPAAETGIGTLESETVQPVSGLEAGSASAAPAQGAPVGANPGSQIFDPQLQNPSGSTIPGAAGDPVAQVTSVSELTDVDPNNWAFQALQSLVERYGCVAGYPDRTFRGNRATTRYEFAAGLYACLNSLSQRIGQVSPEDLAAIRRLQEEFASEIAALRGKVDALEARTTELEENQFSTTTKLVGEAIFAPAGVTGDFADADPDTDIESNIIAGYRVRLNFDTSFFGEDRLRVRTQFRDIPNFTNVTGTAMSRLGFDGTGNSPATILDDLHYRVPIGENGQLYIAAANLEFYDAVETLNPLLESSARGAISRFGRFNPIYRLGGDGTGLVFNYDLGEKVSFSAGYLAPTGNATEALDIDGDDNAGLIGGEYAASAQLVFNPTEDIGLGLTYVRSYLPDGDGVTGSTGSDFANDPFGGAPTNVNAFGAQASVGLGSKFTVSGWAGYFLADAVNGTANDADIFNYAVTLGFPDLGREGNLGALIFGQPPKVLDNTLAAREDPDTSFHIEGLYRFQVNDNISITPGAFVILNPEHNGANDPIFVGTIRTTFTF